LARTLKSLEDQTDPGFVATLVMDGCPPPDYAPRYPWLKVIRNPKRVGVRNNAGEVRNQAIRVAATEWVAFVDDDDTLAPDYIETLRREVVKTPRADAVIFRMRTNKAGGLKVLPPPGVRDFRAHLVGISFAVKRYPECFEGGMFSFTPGGTEDFVALDRLRRSGATIMLSPRVVYFVEMLPEDSSSFEVGQSIAIRKT
jgi:glycosyltransferase involved in cell wall biosynthesis